MKISIIIPVYNVESYIEKCIRSVEQQTYPNIEVLLIDDCGNDKSVTIAKQIIHDLPNKDIFSIIKHEKNRGLSAARNTGIEHATGTYIFFLDSDDQIVPNCIQKLVELAKIYQPDFVMADHTEIGRSPMRPPFHLEYGFLPSNEEILNAYLSRRLYVMAWNRLIKTDFIKKNKLYFQEGIIYEDELWSFMVAWKAYTIFVSHDKTYNYTIREGSITYKMTPHHYHSRSKVIEGMVNYVNSEPPTKKQSEIYNHIEELKSAYFAEILSSSIAYNCKYNFYKKLRSNTFTADRLPKGHRHTIPQLIRNIHYILPIRMGYEYYRVALKIKNMAQLRLQ